MGRYETIGTTIGMKQVYNGDLIAEMREKYHDEDFHMSHIDHRKWVNRACDLAEQADDPMKFSEDETRRAMIWFGICLDSERWQLNPEKAEEDLDILSIRKKINDQHAEERAKIRELLDKSKELISEEEWQQILIQYCDLRTRKKDSEKPFHPVTKHWHRIITGRATILAKEVLQNGTENELKQALTYLKVCIDVNTHLLDYKKFRDDNAIIELGKKFGVDIN